MRIVAEGQTYSHDDDLERFCKPLGIQRQRWDLSKLDPKVLQGDVEPDRMLEEIITAVEAPLNDLKAQHGYRTQDLVVLNADTPGLDEMLTRFDAVHHHTDEEVRAVIDGEGIFGMVTPQGERFEIVVSAGDLIIVPENTRHWFTLTNDRYIIALRIFQDKAGWTPIYEEITAEPVGVGR